MVKAPWAIQFSTVARVSSNGTPGMKNEYRFQNSSGYGLRSPPGSDSTPACCPHCDGRTNTTHGWRQMELPKPRTYSLRIKPKSSYEVQAHGSLWAGFVKPDTRTCPKLYVLAQGNDIHYVGITNRSMSSRINSGLKAKGKHGYHGYKWKDIQSPFRLLVWSFPEKSGKLFLRELETVEAEFAFLVRKDTGKWPLSQTEIHFYQASDAHLAAAALMVKHCTL